MRKLLLSLCFGAIATASLAANSIPQAQLNNLVKENSDYLAIVNEFLPKEFIGPNQGKALSYADFQELLITKFFLPLNKSYSLTVENGYTSASVESFLKVYQTCENLKNTLDRNTLRELDREYQHLCAKTILVYSLAGNSPDYVYSYSLAAITQNVPTLQNIATKAPLKFTYALPSYEHYVKQGIFPNVKESFRITIVQSLPE